MKLNMGIDPGDSIGWAMGMGEDLHSSGTIEGTTAFAKALHKWLRHYDMEWVAYERFNLRVSSPEAERTIECVGVIKWVCTMRRVKWVAVEASHKRKTIKEVSKTVGSRHARDAEAIRLWALRYGSRR